MKLIWFLFICYCLLIGIYASNDAEQRKPAAKSNRSRVVKRLVATRPINNSSLVETTKNKRDAPRSPFPFNVDPSHPAHSLGFNAPIYNNFKRSNYPQQQNQGYNYQNPSRFNNAPTSPNFNNVPRSPLNPVPNNFGVGYNYQPQNPNHFSIGISGFSNGQGTLPASITGTVTGPEAYNNAVTIQRSISQSFPGSTSSNGNGEAPRGFSHGYNISTNSVAGSSSNNQPTQPQFTSSGYLPPNPPPVAPQPQSQPPPPQYGPPVAPQPQPQSSLPQYGPPPPVYGPPEEDEPLPPAFINGELFGKGLYTYIGNDGITRGVEGSVKFKAEGKPKKLGLPAGASGSLLGGNSIG